MTSFGATLLCPSCSILFPRICGKWMMMAKSLTGLMQTSLLITTEHQSHCQLSHKRLLNIVLTRKCCSQRMVTTFWRSKNLELPNTQKSASSLPKTLIWSGTQCKSLCCVFQRYMINPECKWYEDVMNRMFKLLAIYFVCETKTNDEVVVVALWIIATRTVYSCCEDVSQLW